MTKPGLLTVTATDTAAVISALRQVLTQTAAVAILPSGNSARSRAVMAAVQPDIPVASDIGVVATTSGSTGKPKGVLISYSAISASILAVNQELGFTPQWHLVLPMQHIAGTMTAIRGLSDDSQLHQPTINAADPTQLAAYAKSIKDLVGLHAITLVPEHLNRLAVINELPALRYFHKVIIGAGKLDQDLREQLADLNISVVNSYGLTETCGGVVWDGKPLNSVSISLNELGEVLISSDMNASGYRGIDADLSVINTHDLGSFDSGKLELLGRSDNLVKVKGHFVDLVATGSLATEISGAESVALLINEDLHIVVANKDVNLEKLSSKLIDELGAGLKGATIALRENLPRTDLGKIDFFTLRLELTDV